jgi:hypothetical protein
MRSEEFIRRKQPRGLTDKSPVGSTGPKTPKPQTANEIARTKQKRTK